MMRPSARTLVIVCIAFAVSGQMLAQPSSFDRLVPQPPVKGDGPAGPGHASEDTGGPDAFGYTFIDSNEPGGPAAGAFVDISGTGTPVLLADDAEQSVPIGFTFSYYGVDYTNVFLVSNGFLSFPGGDTSFTNECPIDPASPPDAIFPYWDDLDPFDDGAAAYYENFGSCPVGDATGCTIFQWEEFDFFPGDGAPGGNAGTFQAILYDNGKILYQYEGGPGLDGASATVGINSNGADFSLLYACDTAGSITPGLAILFELGDVGDLAITKSGDVSLGGNTTYEIAVENLGPEDQTGVVVTDVLAAELDYVSDDCGGSFDGGTSTWTWTIGDLAAGNSDTCNLVVSLNTPDCVAVENTAEVTGDLIDPGANSSSTTSNGGGNVVDDPGFEAGTPNPFWAEASTNFGTPLCDLPSCGTGTGTGPRSGDWWAWFGGIAAPEEGSVSQDVQIGVGATTLSFWLEAIVCASPADFLEVLIDGNQVAFFDGTSPFCGALGYHEETVDISAFADGAVHTLEFHSIITGAGTTNFFVDDVALDAPPTCVEPPFELDVSKSGTSNGDGTGTYVITVTNIGPGDGNGIVVSDTLPAGVAYNGNDCGAAFDDGTNTLTWDVGALAENESATCAVDVTVIDFNDTENEACATGGAGTACGSGRIEALAIEIPTLGGFGLALMALLLGAGSVAVLRRRR